jgi:UDP-N-acetyl-2-amino-2-deoxyglucuronate dehydrogenase
MFNVALVGCGRIAKRHSDLLLKGQIQNARLVAVCDVIESRSEALVGEHGIPRYTDMHQMMRSQPIDIVVVLTPSGMHADHVTALAPYGKSILVEKPMALALEDADRMIQACDAHNARLFVVKQNRFNVPIRKLREAIEAKRFGKMVLGTVRVRWCRDQSYYDQDSWRGTWALDGGVLANQASHHLDMLEWMMGEVTSVHALSTTALVNIETEDTAVVLLKFANGALGVIEATTAARPKDLEGSISILGEKGTVVVGGFALNKMETWNFTNPTEDDQKVIHSFNENPPNVYGYGHKAYYDHVVDCLLNNKKQLVDGLEGRKSIELLNAIYESIETGRSVSLKYVPRPSSLLGRKSEEGVTHAFLS